MQMQDKLEKEKADAKNAVEEYVYEMRDKIYTSLEQYVNEDVSFMSISIFRIILMCVWIPNKIKIVRFKI